MNSCRGRNIGYSWRVLIIFLLQQAQNIFTCPSTSYAIEATAEFLSNLNSMCHSCRTIFMFLNIFFFRCVHVYQPSDTVKYTAGSASALYRKLFPEKSFPVFGVKTIQRIKICQIELNSRKFCNLLEFVFRHEKPNYINRPTAAWRR